MLAMNELEMPLWFGEVAPGSDFVKRVSLRNNTSLPFPFEWSTSAYPQARHGKDFNVPLPDEEALHDAYAEDGVLMVDGQANRSKRSYDTRRGHGQADALAIGAEPDLDFAVQPAAGVLPPGELVEFTVVFSPQAVGRFERWAQLRVDRTVPGQPPQGCNAMVAEVGLEGVGAPLECNLTPANVAVTGTLMPRQVVKRQVTLHNPTRAPTPCGTVIAYTRPASRSPMVTMPPVVGSPAWMLSATLCTVVFVVLTTYSS